MVAGLVAWHDAHAVSLRALRNITQLPGHVLIEATSVLTRLPRGLAIPVEVAARCALRELPHRADRAAPDLCHRQGMAGTRIDLNCDLGEGFGVWTLGEDEALLEVVTSANVACGYHAGDPSIMRRVCRRAAKRNVRIGAQVGYRDLAGFGRRPMEVPPDVLTDEVIYQIGALDAFARIAGSRVCYVKPHGALYNTCVTDATQAGAVVRAVTEIDANLPVLGLPGSELLRAADAAGLTTVGEAFADRSYDAAGHLVSRRLEGAVISDPKVVLARCLRLVREGMVTAMDGTQVQMSAASLCLHGDTPGAVRLAQRVRDGLAEAGVSLVPFC